MPISIVDELEMGRVVMRLAMAADDRDFEAYRACLFDWVDAALPGETADLVPADDYARSAIKRASASRWTHHRPSVPLLMSGTVPDRTVGLVDFVVSIGWRDTQGNNRSTTAGGRYHLGFVRRAETWLICQRSTVWRYRDGDLPPLFT